VFVAAIGAVGNGRIALTLIPGARRER